MKALTDLSVKLNKQSDELNQIIKDTNSKLSSLNIGLEVWLDFQPIKEDPPAEEDPKEHEEVQLGYCRVEDNWQLATRTVILVSGVDYFGRPTEEIKEWLDLQPLLKESREIRVRAMACLPSLLDALTREAKSAIDSIEEARKTVDSL